MKRLRPIAVATFILATITFLSACKKNSTTDNTEITALSVYNFVPTVGTYDVYLNDGKMNIAALPFGGGLKYATVANVSNTVKFTIAGNANSILTKAITLSTNNYGTLFLVGNTSNLETVYTTDAVKAGSADKAYIRLANFSPDAPAIDLAVNGGSTLTTNKAYKVVGDFVEVTPGTFTFDIKASTGGQTLAQKTDVTLSSGAFYTIALGGLNTPANNERALTAVVYQQQ